MVDLYDVHNARFAEPTPDDIDASLRESFGMTSTPQVTDTANGEDVWSRLAAVQRDLNAPKNQRNSFGNYNYRSCEDILSAVKPLLARERLLLTISDTLEYIGDRHYVKALATVVSLDGSGGMVQVSAYAREASDRKGMDDSQVTGSTSSYARKYALNGLFLIDDTKDADTDEHQRQRQSAPAPSTAQRRAPQAQSHQPAQNGPQGGEQQVSGGSGPRTDQQGRALWKISNGNRDLIAQWCQPYGVTSDRDLTEQQAAEILAQYGGGN